MAELRRQFIDGEYGQIHLRTATPENPTQPPLYCLHMSPKSGQQFENFMRVASNDRIVVASDYPGYGESARPPEEPHVTVPDYARSVWRVADTLDHTMIDLFGHHTGSLVAAEMAHQTPERINKIVMVSAAVLTEKERVEFDSFFSPIPLDEEGTRFKIMWERINHFKGPSMTFEMMAESMAENLRGGENYEWGHRAAFAYCKRYEEIISSLPHRITVLNPKDELFEHTKRAKALLRNGVIIDHPEWGHGFLDAFTDDAVKAVKEALQ